MADVEDTLTEADSSRGADPARLPEGVVYDLIKRAAGMKCEHCDAPLMTAWKYCPSCGMLVVFAKLREPGGFDEQT